MSKFSIKILSAVTIILFIAIAPIVAFATNEEDVSIVSTITEDGQQEYIIYINGKTEESFKYAFSNQKEGLGILDLEFKIADETKIDENTTEYKAYLDAKTYENLSSGTIYMWAKDENENLFLEGIELNLKDSINKDNIDFVESITKSIKVDTNVTTQRQETIEGVLNTITTGAVKITDTADAKYYYQSVRVATSEKYNQLIQLVEKINKEYDEMDMYSKIKTSKEFYNLFTELTTNIEWQEVEDMIVKQPEDAKDGEKFIVFLKKVDEQNEIIDAQFLTSSEDYMPIVEKEKVVTQETTRLPITYDNILLILSVLAIVVISLVVVYNKMKKLNKNSEEK